MQSLLFCQDEKSARALIPLLDGLDIAVRHETEVFSAMRSLMAECFDFLIIDCEDEPTRRLLLRNAHGSPGNKTALVVAVVARETGANALRFGADFLVTKPIMVEQAGKILRLVRTSILRSQQISPAKRAKPATTAKTEAASSESGPPLASVAPAVSTPAVEASLAAAVVATANSVVVEAEQKTLSEPAAPAAQSVDPAPSPEPSSRTDVVESQTPGTTAVTEIKKTPSPLFMASMAAAIGAVLLIVAVIAWHSHPENSDEDGRAAQPAANASAQPNVGANPSAAPARAAPQTPVQVGPEPVTAEPSAVSVEFKYNNEKVKPRPAASAVTPGQLSVNSTPPGARGKQTMKVASGSKSSISAQLVPSAAIVSVTSDPSDATLWMDGRDTGQMTPAQISVDQPGNHTFVFKKQGYLDEITAANLRMGQTFHLAPSLRPLGRTDEIKMVGKFGNLFGGSETAGMGTVSVKTQPKGAQIAVNTRTLDKPSPAEFYLNPGNYVIDITASGFKIIHRVVSVDKGGKVAIDEVMDPE
jgi:hypothetical protein